MSKVIGGDKMTPGHVTSPPCVIADAIRLTVEGRGFGKLLKATTINPSVLVTRGNVRPSSLPHSPC